MVTQSHSRFFNIYMNCCAEIRELNLCMDPMIFVISTRKFRFTIVVCQFVLHSAAIAARGLAQVH